MITMRAACTNEVIQARKRGRARWRTAPQQRMNPRWRKKGNGKTKGGYS